MYIRTFSTQIDATSKEPIAFQIAKLFAREILDGRLPPGSTFPGCRTIAKELNITKHAAYSAVRELELHGWIVCSPRGTTLVSRQPPASIPALWGPQPVSRSIPYSPAFDFQESLKPVTSVILNGYDLTEGLPDVRLMPQEALWKGYQQALRLHGDRLLKQPDNDNQTLREGLAFYLRIYRGLRTQSGNVLITYGTPLSITLIAQALLPEGGHVAIENPGDPTFWEALRCVDGVHLHPVPVDEHGMDTDRLSELLSQYPVKLVILTPQFQYPTTVTLSQERRSSLLELSRRFGFILVENDPEYDFFGTANPNPPLANMDTEGRVIHLGSFSQLLAPSLGLGFLAASNHLVEDLERLFHRKNIRGDPVMEWVLSGLIRNGDFALHLAQARPVYNCRRSDFREALERILGKDFRAIPASGGLACWVRCPASLDLEAWAAACRQQKVKIRPGRHHDFHGHALPFLRIGFGEMNQQEMTSALERMRIALDLVQP